MDSKKLVRRILEVITLPNVTKGLDVFNKAVSDFGSSMDSMMKEMSSDVAKSNERQKKESIKNQKNLEKIYGKSDVKIWSDSI